MGPPDPDDLLEAGPSNQDDNPPVITASSSREDLIAMVNYQSGKISQLLFHLKRLQEQEKARKQSESESSINPEFVKPNKTLKGKRALKLKDNVINKVNPFDVLEVEEDIMETNFLNDDAESVSSVNTVSSKKRRFSSKGSKPLSITKTLSATQEIKKPVYKHIVSEGKTLVVLDSSASQPSIATTPPAPTMQDKAKLKKPPVLLIDNKEDPLIVQHLIKQNNIKLAGNILTKKRGYEVFTETPDDYRNLIKLCKISNIKYCSWQLEDEKQLHFVIKNVPTTMPSEDLQAFLLDQDYPVTSVKRMSSKQKGDLPVVVVNTEKSEKGLNLYNLKHIDGLGVQVEKKKNSPDYRQCYRCQKWGHVSYRCNMAQKCVKCAGDHRSSECNRSEKDKLKCANCNGEHAASSSECPAHPKTLRAKREEHQRNLLAKSVVRQGTSYASCTSSASGQMSEATIEAAVERVLERILSKMMVEKGLIPRNG